jgi:signal transduction histidine kinase
MKHEDNTKETLTDKSQASNEALRLYAALVRQLYKHAPIGIVATIANSFILTFILWNVIPHSILISWLSATVSIAFLRYLSLCKYWRSSPTSAEACRWATWFIIGIALSGIVWGFAGIFLFSVDSIAHQVFLAFVISGMVAAAAGTFSIMMKAFLAYSLPALAPIIMRFFVIGDNIHLAMGAMGLLFGLLMFFTAKRVNAAIVSSLKLQFEHSNLINHLAAEKECIEKLNESLNSEVTERKRAEEETKNTLAELQEMQDMLVQSGKLAAIGRLTAGVTHEILNPVNIISMKLQLLEMTGRLPPETMTEIDICKAQLERIISITKDLSHFSRIPEKQMRMEDLNNVIENVLALCAPQFKVENH